MQPSRWSVRNLLNAIIKPVHKHPARQWYEFSVWNDPQLAELKDFEHGIYRRLSSEMVYANGLLLTYEGEGAVNVRVN